MEEKTAVIFGAGAYGSALAVSLSENFNRVLITVRREDQKLDLLNHKNENYLPGIKFPKNIIPVLNVEEINKNCLGEVKLLVSGVPTGAILDLSREYKNFIEKCFGNEVPMVVLSKGIDPEKLLLSDDLFYQNFRKYKNLFTFLSGPSFANELALKKITLVSLAGRSVDALKKCSYLMQTSYFNVYKTMDVKGVLLGGALKNVLAIAGGVAEGIGHEHNTRAALITMGIFDMLRIGNIYNAMPGTFYGLSGMGDLILTTTGGQSRNKSFGLKLASGKSVDEILSESNGVVEGYKTSKAVYEICTKYKLKCPLFTGVYNVLYNKVEARKEIERLMRVSTKFSGFV